MARTRSADAPAARANRLRALTEEYLALAARLREGGGAARVKRDARQGAALPARAGRPAARSRVALARDRAARRLRPVRRAGARRRRHHRRRAWWRGARCVVVANDATVKAGSWWPETITKILRAQEVAMRQRIPIIYLVDSAGVNLPYQGGVFPGQYGAARIFYYNSLMRRYLQRAADQRRDGKLHRRRRVPAGAVRRDLHGGGHQLHGAGRPQPGQGRHRPDRRRRDAGRGPRRTPSVSAVAHYRAPNDAECLRADPRVRRPPAA